MNNVIYYTKNKEIPSPYWLFTSEYAWDQNMSAFQASKERSTDIDYYWQHVKYYYIDVIRILKAQLLSLKDDPSLISVGSVAYMKNFSFCTKDVQCLLEKARSDRLCRELEAEEPFW